MIIAFYTGTRPGLPGIYNRGVRRWTVGPYSHVEAVFSNGQWASSSFEDGGVRFKAITFNPANWFLVWVPDELESGARQWFIDHKGWKYDLLGNVHFVIPLVRHSKRRAFCSGAIAAALRFVEPWRFHPNSLAAVLLTMYPDQPPQEQLRQHLLTNQPAEMAGFSL